MGKFGCCLGSSAADADAYNDRGAHANSGIPRSTNSSATELHRNGTGGRTNSNGNKKSAKRVSFQKGSATDRGPSPHSEDMLSSQGSARSSVYFDAEEGDDDAFQSLDGFDESFVTMQIDGQYFFNAKDDPSVSAEAFEGIHMYPPLPTTEPDPMPLSPISMTNPQSLLHAYQHSKDDMDEEKKSEEANDLAVEKMGVAMENQAKRLSQMTLSDAKSSQYLGESTNLLLKELKEVNVKEKGFPGELTDTELAAVKRFQSELQTRDPVYNNIVRALFAVEKEAYALCRWLRARKFDVDKVFELLEEAVPHYTKAKDNEFYPDLEKALGFGRSVFLSQYPSVFCGNAKNGCPVQYLQLGSIQPEGMKCIVSLSDVDRYFWHDTIFGWVDVLKEGRRLNPNCVRTENVTIYDLKGVSRSQITSDTFEMIKLGNQVMSSFPETLHCLLLINAPGWFGFVWSVVKKLIDPRTAAKIEVFTNAKAGSKRMDELIEKSQIPSDYGGTNKSLNEAASGGGAQSSGKANKMVVLNHLLNLPKKNSEKSHTFELDNEQPMTITVYTRCKAGAHARLCKGDADTLVSEIDLAGEEDDTPYSRALGAVYGPGKFTVKLKAKSSPGLFLVLGTTAASG